MTEDYAWQAVYRDGTVLDEYRDDGSGKTHGFAAVEHERLAVFRAIPQRDGLPYVHVSVPEGDPDFRVVWFRRRTIGVNAVTGAENGRGTITVLGWQRWVKDADYRNGRNFKSLMAIYPDGSTLLTDDPEAF